MQPAHFVMHWFCPPYFGVKPWNVKHSSFSAWIYCDTYSWDEFLCLSEGYCYDIGNFAINVTNHDWMVHKWSIDQNLDACRLRNGPMTQLLLWCHCRAPAPIGDSDVLPRRRFNIYQELCCLDQLGWCSRAGGQLMKGLVTDEGPSKSNCNQVQRQTVRYLNNNPGPCLDYGHLVFGRQPLPILEWDAFCGQCHEGRPDRKNPSTHWSL